MTHAEYKAAFNEAIRARQSGKKVNIDDVLCNAELAQIAKEKHADNGNGSEPERYCDCSELIIYGKRYPCPPGHDCKYAEAVAVTPSRKEIGDSLLRDRRSIHNLLFTAYQPQTVSARRKRLRKKS